MPRKLILPFIPVFLIPAGWFAAFYYQNLSTQKQDKQHLRTLASVAGQSTIKMEKHLMPIQLNVWPVDEIPEGPGELVIIKAELRTPHEGFGAISYTWDLPQDVEVIKGHVTGNLPNPIAGEIYVLELVLKNFDKQYRKELVLRASILNRQGQVLSNTRVITSRPEDSMEHLAPLMMVKAQESNVENRSPAAASED